MTLGLRGMLHLAISLATCVAAKLRDKLQDKLHSVTAPLQLPSLEKRILINAFDKSRNSPMVNFLLSIADETFSYNSIKAKDVKRPFRKPYIVDHLKYYIFLYMPTFVYKYKKPKLACNE